MSRRLGITVFSLDLPRGLDDAGRPVGPYGRIIEDFPDGADVKVHDEVLFIDENTARITISLTEDLGEYVPEPTVLEAQQSKLIVPFDQDKQYSTDELPELPADFVVDDRPAVAA